MYLRKTNTSREEKEQPAPSHHRRKTEVEGQQTILEYSMPRIEEDVKLDFKDVLIRPKRSTLRSRSEVGK